MMTESNGVGGTTHTVQCECHDMHFMQITWYPDDREGSMTIGGAYAFPRWRHRLRAAWQALTGSDHMTSWVEVELDGSKARELSAVLGVMAGGAEMRRETTDG